MLFVGLSPKAAKQITGSPNAPATDLPLTGETAGPAGTDGPGGTGETGTPRGGDTDKPHDGQPDQTDRFHPEGGGTLPGALRFTRYAGGTPEPVEFPDSSDGLSPVAIAWFDGEAFAWYSGAGAAEQTVGLALQVLDDVVLGIEAEAPWAGPVYRREADSLGNLITDQVEMAILVDESPGTVVLRIRGTERWTIVRIYFDDDLLTDIEYWTQNVVDRIVPADGS